MVNGPYQIYIEKKGKGNILTNKKFRDKEHVMHVIEKIISPLGKRVDETKPYTNARLPDGSRVHVIAPPVAPKGPYISIRKFENDPFTINDLISFNTLTPEMAKFLEACVKARINIMVSGGTSSGKTTVLNCLTSFINEDERILVIEDPWSFSPGATMYPAGGKGRQHRGQGRVHHKAGGNRGLANEPHPPYNRRDTGCRVL